MVNTVLFLLVIFGANIMQGITGFAGTILAMSPSLLLVGYDIAKPVLNVLALISGAYVFLGNVKYVNWRELWKIVVWMAAGILAGVWICRESGRCTGLRKTRAGRSPQPRCCSFRRRASFTASSSPAGPFW